MKIKDAIEELKMIDPDAELVCGTFPVEEFRTGISKQQKRVVDILPDDCQVTEE
jgi:hypothetical protein